MKLDNKLEQSIKFKGKKHKINLSYDNVLKAFDFLEDEFLLPHEKNIFYLNTLSPTAYKVKPADLIGFANVIKDEFFTDNNKPNQSGPKTVDLKQDESYIYASFKQAYNIDLKSDRLAWSQFIALFVSLPDDTKIREIMSIRSRPIPIQTKYNGAEIQNLIKLKQFYSLVSADKGQNLADGLAEIFQTLKERAVK